MKKPGTEWTGEIMLGVGWALLDAQVGDNRPHRHVAHQVQFWRLPGRSVSLALTRWISQKVSQYWCRRDSSIAYSHRGPLSARCMSIPPFAGYATWTGLPA